MRLFVGLDLPPPLRSTLADHCAGLQGARWVPPENFHLTLRFIGEANNLVAEEIDLALAALRGRRFPLCIAGTGLFERPGRAATLWAGIDRSPALDLLQSKVETALQRAGIAADRRRFQPHVSLGRVDLVAPDRIAAWMQAHNLLRTEPVEIAHFTLFSSQLGKDQAVYTAEVEYGLA